MDKIRDLREKFFQIDDEYLNGYARLCGINATGVYLSMCRHANKEQRCFPSKKLIAKELAISERSVYNAIKKLKEWNIISIEEQGRKDDGSFKVKVYTLLDKNQWKTKPEPQAKHRRQMVPSANNDKSPQARGAQEGNTYIKETHISEQSSQKVFNHLEWIEKLKNSKQAHIRIIGWYFEIKAARFPTEAAAQKELRRWTKTARTLSDYPRDKILEAKRLAAEKYPKEWKLSTIEKIIPFLK